jgi:low affinity Fe/Cu permease
MTPPPFRQTRFDRFAEAISRYVSEAAFFIISLIVVIGWMPTILLFHDADTWQLVIATASSVLGFLLIALLQNTARRYDRALHHKVDTIARGLVSLMEQPGQPDPAALGRSIDELSSAIGIEERI